MFYKKVNYKSNKEMFEFLHDHYRYDVMNSWNQMKTYANNVKLYNLNLKYDYCEALAALEETQYSSINMMIKDWEYEHPNTTVYFNGRSGGYLVLKILDKYYYSPSCYDDYDSWKEDIKTYYGTLKNYTDLKYEVELVQDFDQLCDDLIEEVNYLVEQRRIRLNNTHTWKTNKRYTFYSYDTLDDYNFHKKYMLDKGYIIFDENEEDLYIEYEMNENEEGEVVMIDENLS